MSSFSELGPQSRECQEPSSLPSLCLLRAQEEVGCESLQTPELLQEKKLTPLPRGHGEGLGLQTMPG